MLALWRRWTRPIASPQPPPQSIPEAPPFKESAVGPAEENPYGASPPLAGLRVLLVEDNPDTQVLVSRYLRLAGATVETADNGLEGVRAAQGRRFDLILMDLQMPVMGGLEATRELRGGGYDGPIFALSAYNMPEHRQRSLDAGCDDHLVKPIAKGELVRRVAEARRATPNDGPR